MATGSWSRGLLTGSQDRDPRFSSLSVSSLAVTTRSIRDPAQGVYEYLEERHEEQGAKVGCYLFPMQLSGWMLRREGRFTKKYRRRFCVFDASTNQLRLYEDDNTSAESGKLLRELVVTSVEMTVHKGIGDLEVTGYELDKEMFKEDSDRIARRRSGSGNDQRAVHLPGDKQRFYRPQLEHLRTVSTKACNVWGHCFRHHMKNYRRRQQMVRLAEIEATGEWDVVKDEELFEEDDDDASDEEASSAVEPEFSFRETRLDQLAQRDEKHSTGDSHLVFDGESSVRITKNGDFSSLGYRMAGKREDVAPSFERRQGSVPVLRRDSTGSFCEPVFALASDASIGAFLLQSSNTIWDDENLLAFRVDYDAVKRTRLLSSGSFGEVWLAQYRGTQTIAVKTLKALKDRKRAQIQTFLNEIRLISQLQHDRIVTFLGLAWTMESDVQMLMEYMPYGDLRTYLVYLSSQQQPGEKRKSSKTKKPTRAETDGEATWTRTQWRMAVDIIEGLVYLHSLRDPLVHCDLKSRNLLLDVDLRVKIADFGIAQFYITEPRDDHDRDTSTTDSGESSNSAGSRLALSNHASATNVLQGTGRWLAPELLAGGSGDSSPAVDVYSFGVVLSEIDTCELPFHDRMANEAGQSISEDVLLHHILVDAWTPSFLPTCPPSVLTIANECLASEPQRRPSSLDVAHRLRKAMAAAVGKKPSRK